MKKVLALLMSLVITVVALSGCGTAKDASDSKSNAGSAKESPKKDIVLAGIYKAGDQQWFIGEGAAAKDKAIKMGAKDFMFIDAKMNPDTYLQALDNAIAQGVSGILVCVPDQKLSAVTMEKA
ncbi:MAG TPA: LacI family transcriptional regulator, partial [Clostridiaceae bacterium]|nr:LacI family transcriptional regulator [Clostridiaceae bacterium]